MRIEEVAPGALDGADLGAVSGEDRVQYTRGHLDLARDFLGHIGGPGAGLSVLAALDGGRKVAAIPLLRTTRPAAPRPFPLDFEDTFFGLWMRHVRPDDRALRARAAASRAFHLVLRRLNPSLGRSLVLHAPLAPVSEALVARGLPPAQREDILCALVARARQIAADEGRCLFLPRLDRRHSSAWGRALFGLTRVRAASNAEYLPMDPLDRRTRQMLRRNARLMERAGVTVETTREAPGDIPFGALFAQTASRHKDPAPRLDEAYFRELGSRLAPRVRFLSARRAGRPVGFLVVLEHGHFWEAFKCGTDRHLAADAPVYLDLLYGKLRDMAAAAGVTRVDLGPGDLPVKRHYGARPQAIDSFVALPPSFRGAGLFTAYLHEIGEGIAAHESREKAAP